MALRVSGLSKARALSKSLSCLHSAQGGLLSLSLSLSLPPLPGTRNVKADCKPLKPESDLPKTRKWPAATCRVSQILKLPSSAPGGKLLTVQDKLGAVNVVEEGLV